MSCPLAESAAWRIRRAVVQLYPLVAAAMGADYFNAQLLSLYQEAYEDEISAVRVSTVETLPQLAEALGQEWLKANMTIFLETLYNRSNNLFKITVRTAGDPWTNAVHE